MTTATKSFEISNRVSGLVLGVYQANSPEEALDVMARDAGCRDFADACEIAGTEEGEIEVVEIGAVGA